LNNIIDNIFIKGERKLVEDSIDFANQGAALKLGEIGCNFPQNVKF